MTKEELYQAAVAAGCKPIWADGMAGWAWHCDCDNLAHACDSQCSMISTRSIGDSYVLRTTSNAGD